ncbi:MAG: glutathione S-transferase family protein [Cellvibrionaceae bacterium]|nr:glutathione S-transferase family protein [Cellvibrionaceae bacterium]MCV6626310.1 glutathione S-transferase family protein [Cellvibrionaceae bacterium]
MPKIYGAILSPYVRKVLLVLEAKGVEYENQQVFPGALPEGYEKISPLGKIPALQEGDFSLSDSTVINEYLEERYSQHPMFPVGTQDRAKARWLEEFADTALVDALLVPFFQRIVAPMRGLETDNDAIAKAEAKIIPKALAYVESVVPGADFLFEQRLTIADIALVSPFINAEIGGYQLDAERWPKTAAYVAFVRGQDIIQAREAKEKALLGQ